MDRKKTSFVLCLIAAMIMLASGVSAAAKINTDPKQQLPDPDGKPADMTKPVQVFILMGQSNMVGAGKVQGDKEGSLTYAVQKKNKYPYLVDDEGNWTERKDVRYVRVMGSGTGKARQFNNEWMTVKGGRIGPELGIGHVMGHVIDAPVMILKSCIGNRSLGWDLLPPGSQRYEVEEKDRKTGETKTFVYGKRIRSRGLLLLARRQGSLQCRTCRPVRAESCSVYQAASQGLQCPESQVRLRHSRPDQEGRRRQ